VFFRTVILAFAFLPAGQTVFAQPGVAPAMPAGKADVQSIVKQAVANFSARESLPKDYTYQETVKAEDPRLKHGHSIDVYEIIEIKGHGFRRHLEHDGRKIARTEDHEQDEAYRVKWLDVEHKILEEQIKPGHTRESLAAAVRKIMEEAGLTDWQPQLFDPIHLSSMGVVYFTQTLYQFKLPIEQLDRKFDLKLKEEKLLNGRATYVIQADPKRSKDKEDPAANFKMKVWIDRNEMQIVKVEGDALRMGPLATPEYSSFSSKSMSEKELEERRQQLVGSRLCYGDDTRIVQEWAKVNDEIWLLRRRHVQGSHLFFFRGNTRPSYSSTVEYDVEETNYKKFRVQHRFLSAVRRLRSAALEQ
jgi:hypothetical protein